MVAVELFDVLGHLDMPERREPFRGLSRPSDYDRIGQRWRTSGRFPKSMQGLAVCVHDIHRIARKMN